MKNRLNAYIQGLFAEAEKRSPANGRLAELKEELLLNTEEKYDDLVAAGKTPEAAYRAAVDGIGDISELIRDVVGDTRVPEEPVKPAEARISEEASASSSEEQDARRMRDEEPSPAIAPEESGRDGGNGKEAEAPPRPPRSRWYALVSGIIWTLILVSYFLVSFATHAWSVTWLLFIMGIAADNVARCIFDLRR